MSEEQTDVIRLLREKAAALPATVLEAADLEEAARYVASLCAKKPPRENLLPGKEPAQPRLIAAPDIGAEAWRLLNEQGRKQGVACVDRGLREYAGGIDLGVARAELVVADTVTCVVASDREDVRLATMLCEICVVLASRSKVVTGLQNAAPTLRALQSGAAYTAFISGPSRTADIERVAALGVHGPLELHIVLLED